MSSLRALQGRGGGGRGGGRGGGGGGGGCNQGLPVVNGSPWDTGQPNGVSQFGRRTSTANVVSRYNAYFHGGSLTLYPASGGGSPINQSSCSGGRGFGEEAGFRVHPDYVDAGYFVDQDASGTGLCGANFRRCRVKVSYGGKSTSTVAIPDTGTNQLGQGFMMAETAQKLGINYRNMRNQPVSTEQSVHSQYGPVKVSYAFDPNPSPVTVSMGIVNWPAHGDKFDVVPMRFFLERVNALFAKNATVWQSSSNPSQSVTYNCSTNQVTQGDTLNLLPKSGAKLANVVPY
jgi:hypothetical protein